MGHNLTARASACANGLAFALPQEHRGNHGKPLIPQARADTGGRVVLVGCWYGPDGRPVDPAEAQRLLLDVAERLIAEDVITREGEVVLVSTWFTVAETGADAAGQGPILWETKAAAGAVLQTVESYRSQAQAVQGHTRIVQAVIDRLGRTATSNPTIRAGFGLSPAVPLAS